jgi:hypothetical protein
MSDTTQPTALMATQSTSIDEINPLDTTPSVQPETSATAESSSSSIKVGEMERDALIAHGLQSFIDKHCDSDAKLIHVNTHIGQPSALPSEDTITIQPAVAMKQWDHMNLNFSIPGGVPYSLRSSMHTIPSNNSSSSSSAPHLVLPNYNKSSSSSHIVIPNYNNSSSSSSSSSSSHIVIPNYNNSSSSSSTPPMRPRTTSYDDGENKEDGVSMSHVQGQRYPESELSIDEYLSRSRDATTRTSRKQQVYVDSESEDDEITYGERWGTSYNSYTAAPKVNCNDDNTEERIEDYMKRAGQNTSIEGRSMLHNYKNPDDAGTRIRRIMNMNNTDIKLADWVTQVSDSNQQHMQERISFYNRAIGALKSQIEPACLVKIAAKCAAKMSADIGIPVLPIVGKVCGVIHTLYLDFRHDVDIRVVLSFSRNYMRIHSPMGNGKHSYDTMEDFDKVLADTMNQLIAYVLDETTVSKVKNQTAMSIGIQEPDYVKLHLALYTELQEQYDKTITTLMIEEEQMKDMLAEKQEQLAACRHCQRILFERNVELMSPSAGLPSSAPVSTSSSSSTPKQVTFALIPERDM